MKSIFDFITNIIGYLIAGMLLGAVIVLIINALNYSYLELPKALIVLACVSTLGIHAYAIKFGEWAYVKVAIAILVAGPILLGITPQLKTVLSMPIHEKAETISRSLTTSVVSFSCIVVVFIFVMCLYTVYQKKECNKS